LLPGNRIWILREKVLAPVASFATSASELQVIQREKHMIRSTLKLGLYCLIAAALSGASEKLQAQDMPSNVEKSQPNEPRSSKSGLTPFQGKLKAVDKTAKTIAFGKTTVHVTDETKITKEGKPATLDDGVAGEPVAGNYKKGDDGKLIAAMVRFGAKPEAANEGVARKEKRAKKEK
jgi:hypothetical protein